MIGESQGACLHVQGLRVVEVEGGVAGNVGGARCGRERGGMRADEGRRRL